ncbi:MAG TPA: hypothetical protein VFR74_07410 [Jiangellales bacterium]|nr:hypothetical protein [Jiangellales bacterium]
MPGRLPSVRGRLLPVRRRLLSVRGRLLPVRGLAVGGRLVARGRLLTARAGIGVGLFRLLGLVIGAGGIGHGGLPLERSPRRDARGSAGD